MGPVHSGASQQGLHQGGIVIRYSSSLVALAGALFYVTAASAQTALPDSVDSAPDLASTIIVTGRQTRSATVIAQAEIQKVLPGVSPLKAIATLPGVL